MATLKNPSIYDDRGTIGSADELDAYGVWVKIEPEELPDSDADPFPDFDADFGPEIALDETAEDSGAFEDFSYSGGGEDANFDDVEALRQDIQSAPPEHATTAPAGAPASTDLSTQLLMKIADELSSIKTELFSLKEELSVFRSEKPRKNAGGIEAEEGGFFNEEDDGKIALTGDELNNIIHTADFTEEAGADAGGFVPAEAPDPAVFGGEAAFPEKSGEQIPAEADFDAPAEEILYDGLGRPLNRKISGDDEIDTSLELKDSDDLKMLRENGVDPMTAPPEDTSYLEEDPLAGDNFDLLDAVIEEPDLSEGVKDAPLEEPSLDHLPLTAGRENSGETPETGGNQAEEKLFLEDITFEDLPNFENPAEAETPAGAEDDESLDLSFFDEDLPAAEGDLSFEALDEDADLPAQANVQDNVITEDSFESISFDDDEDIGGVTADKDLEQTLNGDMKIDLGKAPLETGGILEEAEGRAGGIATAEVPPAVRMRLKDVLIYMDKLLESLPEEKINEFAHSEHYDTYKKLFEELGIRQ
jgi:hypothetical protein